MTQVTVVDYGAGNLLNVVRALEHVGATVDITSNPEMIERSDRLVLPGVGAFGDCMAALERLNLLSALRVYMASDRLFLGICVGMQVMFEVGEEFGEHKGLGVIAGRVVKIPSMGADGTAHKVPHVGWAEIQRSISWDKTPLVSLDGSATPAMYFVHSYVAMPDDPAAVLATADYNGVSLCAAVRLRRAYGVQFHPEKSAAAGLSILETFTKMPA